MRSEMDWHAITFFLVDAQFGGQGEFVTPAKLPNHHMAIEDQTPAISVHFAAFSNTDIHIFPPVLRCITPLTSCSCVSFCTKIRLGRFPCSGERQHVGHYDIGLLSTLATLPRDGWVPVGSRW